MPEPGRLLPRLPLRRRLAPRLRDRVTLPAPPAAVNWSGGQSSWGMLGNDTVGDCVEAAMLHAVELTSHLTGAGASFSDADALALYTTLAGYNPADPSTDVGTDPTAAVTYWEQTGIGGGRALAAGECDNLQADYSACIAFLGFAFYAFNVPQSALDQYRAGAEWDVVPDDGGIVGGHEVLLVGYDSQTVVLITWGQLWLATWAFVLRYAALTYGVVLPQWLGQNGDSPSGLTGSELVTDAGELGGSGPAPAPPSPSVLPEPGTGVRLWADTESPPPDVATLCLIVNALRLDGFIVRCNDQAIWSAWVGAVAQAEQRLQRPVFLAAYLDTSVQDPSRWPALIQAVSAWVNGPVGYWLDLESGSPDQAQIVAAIAAAQALYPQAGIYTSAGYWQSIDNPQVGGLCPLWLADWTTPVVFGCWFGGWTRASLVQYSNDLQASGLQIDLSAAEG